MVSFFVRTATQTVQIAWIRGYCPVQASGRVDNLPFFFRARGDKWAFAVAQTVESDPVSVAVGLAKGYLIEMPYGRKGQNDAGLMMHRVAYKCVQTGARLYLAKKSRGEM